MGRLAALLVISGTLVTAGASPANAYTQTVNANGTPVRWVGRAKINLAANPINSNGIDSGSFFQAVTRSLQRWNRASGGTAEFDYWQGTDPGVYEPNSGYNGLSSIYFFSNAKVDPHLSPNVLGLTQVWYNTDSGEILETDVVLNDRDFRFTTNPSDTSGYGSATGITYSGGRSKVFIENVLTHELGHAYGLSHSGGLQSTMLFTESPEQAHLGCDESVGIHALYPSADAGARGGIAGSVISESGQPLAAAHVVAVSRRRGTVLATAISDRSGHYGIGALEPGSYFLMVEPFFAGPAALPAYYAGSSSEICPSSQSFGRGALMEGSGFRPQSIVVGNGGGVTSAPPLVAHCGNYGGAVMSSISLSSSSSSPPLVYDGARDGSGFGVIDRFGSLNTSYYKIRAVAGHLEIHALTYSLYSPVRPTLALLSAGGSPVYTAKVEEQVYTGDSGYVNYDSALVADDLPLGEYTVKVSATPLDVTRYPAGHTSLDSVPFLVLTGSVNEGGPALAGSLPVNARCLMDENFSLYTSPGGNPPRRSTEQTHETGFCGMLTSESGSSGGGGSGPTPGAVAGWLLPWGAMALIARVARALARSQKRASPLAV